MHTEKQRIFDDYAKSKGYDNWHQLMKSIMYEPAREDYIFEACDLVQQEQQKRIAENVETLYPYEDKKHWINKESITNTENIIK